MKSRAFATSRDLGDPEGELEDNTAVHQALLDELNGHAAADGWAGTTVTQYLIMCDQVSITVVPGPAFAAIDDLRQAYLRYRKAAAAENDNHNQGRLI
ncbi:hypothetical protein ACIQUB_07170 [Rhizobium sp. NPDC090275]|uniref:hypothetical protein n=1 Tax=Rhizobium sp. NPDC090275 TaxID=3364498 RepID=UPI00383B04B0